MQSYARVPLQHGDVAESSAAHDRDWRTYVSVRIPAIGDFVHPEAMALTEGTEGADGRLKLVNISGPAVWSILFALPLIFIFVTVSPFAMWWLSTCPPKGEIYGHHAGLLDLWAPAFYLPIFIYVTLAEWKSLRFVILPYVQWLHPFQIFCYDVSLPCWLFCQVITSSLAKLDVATSSLFVAKAFKAYTCNGTFWAAAQQAWAHVIKRSIVVKLPFMSHLVGVCFLGWAMIVLQLVLAVLESVPCKRPRSVDYQKKERGETEEGYTTWWTSLLKSIHLRGEAEVYNADALRILSVANRQLSLVELSCQWQMARVCEHLETCDSDVEEQKRCFDMLEKETRSCCFRLWCITVFEKTLILETQVTMYALHKAMGYGHDHWAIFAIWVSWLTLLKTLIVAGKQLLSVQSTYEKVLNKLTGLRQQQQDEDENFAAPLGRCRRCEQCLRARAWCAECLFGLAAEGSLPKRGKVLSAARKSKMWIINMRFGIGVLLAILVHTLVKFIMAAHFCHDGFWNIPYDKSSFDAWGCVDMSNVLAITNVAE